MIAEAIEVGADAANGDGEVRLLCRAGRRCRVVMGGDSPADALDLGAIVGHVTVELLPEALPRRLPTRLERRCSWAPRWAWDRLEAGTLVARAVRELSEHLPRESWLPEGWAEASRRVVN